MAAIQTYFNNNKWDSNLNSLREIHFPGLNLANKVIAALVFDIASEKAGYGASATAARTSRTAMIRFVMNDFLLADFFLVWIAGIGGSF